MSIALAAVAGCEVLKEESGVSGAPDTGRKKVPSQKRESFSCKLFVKVGKQFFQGLFKIILYV